MTLRIPLNFDDAEGGDFDVLDAGVYSAVIEKLVYTPERQVNGETKNPSIRVEYTITEPGSEGRKISQWLYPTPKAIFRVKAFFDAFDAELDELVLDEDTDDNGSHLVLEPDLSGEAVEIKVKKVPKWGDPDKDDNKVDDAPVRIGRSRGATRLDRGHKPPKGSSKPSTRDADTDDDDEDEAPPKRSSRGSEDSGRRRGGRAIR